MASGEFGSVTSTSPSPALVEQKLRAEQLVKNGAGWFLVIAGLSIVNSALTLGGTHFSFIFGLGITQIVDAIGRQSGATGSTLGLIVNVFSAGVFLLLWSSEAGATTLRRAVKVHPIAALQTEYSLWT